jgi:hypothetical protein
MATYTYLVDFDNDLADFSFQPGENRLHAIVGQFSRRLDQNPVFKGNYQLDTPSLCDGWVYLTARFQFKHPGTPDHAEQIFRAELRAIRDIRIALTGIHASSVVSIKRETVST